MRAPVQRKTHSEGTFTAKNSVKKCTFFAGWEDTLRDPPWWLSKSSWEVLYAKANKDEFRKSLETSSSKTRAIVYKTNGLVERWRESLGDRPVSYTHLDVYKRQPILRLLLEAGDLESLKNSFIHFLFEILLFSRPLVSPSLCVSVSCS